MVTANNDPEAEAARHHQNSALPRLTTMRLDFTIGTPGDDG